MTQRWTLVALPWLRAHEEYVEARVVELVERFRRSGSVDYAVVADRETGTLIDGHHRLEALRRLGAKQVPAVLVDYHDAAIGIRTWREGEKVPTKDEVIARAKRGELYPPKTTRHDFVRILDPVDLPLAQLGVPGGARPKEA